MCYNKPLKNNNKALKKKGDGYKILQIEANHEQKKKEEKRVCIICVICANEMYVLYKHNFVKHIYLNMIL